MATNILLINSTVEQKFLFVSHLLQEMASKSSLKDKLAVLNQSEMVQSFLESSRALRSFLKGLSPECDLAIKSILAIGQGPIVFNSIDTLKDKFERLRVLLHTLLEVEDFYSVIGGIIGYYHSVLKLLYEDASGPLANVNERFYYPPIEDTTIESFKTAASIRAGISCLPKMAEIYPIGGSGDRLNLLHSTTGVPLPVAELQFDGISLLERLVRDLQAREYLYWKLYGDQLETPIVFMGSHEKNNATNILGLCQNARWFGRAPDNFQMLVQPLVPQITENGDFSLGDFLKLTLKPGGHGVIWRLAHQEGVFDWLKAKNRHKMLIRQINNPIAGIDNTLLTFCGLAETQHKAFGFVACDRLMGAAEGMLVLKQRAQPGEDTARHPENAFSYAITNVEYTNFKAKGIAETPKDPGSAFSQYPANTNILFADLHAIETALCDEPLPGLMINMKKKASYIDELGHVSQLPSGRLESAMQNIADVITYESSAGIKTLPIENLPSFIMYTHRKKGLSVTKNAYIPKLCVQETPESCFFTMQENCYDLLTTHCQMQLPPIGDINDYLHHGPKFIVRYVPALGPLYQIISQKIQGGFLAERAELVLDVAELELHALRLSGSLKIVAADCFGKTDPLKGRIRYSHASGKCQLVNVTVSNEGIDYDDPSNCYWKDEIHHRASMEIILHGNAEFYASNVVFEGPHHIEVFDGYRTEASMVNGHLQFRSFEIDAPTWYWEYTYDNNDNILLKNRSL